MSKPWEREGISYEDWLNHGNLLLFLNKVMSSNPNLTVLELGSGNSTRVLAKYSRKVISVDLNDQSSRMPVPEQANWASHDINSIALEDNVVPVTGDILTMDLLPLRGYDFDAVFFDLGLDLHDKWLYTAAYKRLVSEQIIDTPPLILIDNSDTTPDFLELLSNLGYVLEIGESQAAARWIR